MAARRKGEPPSRSRVLPANLGDLLRGDALKPFLASRDPNDLEAVLRERGPALLAFPEVQKQLEAWQRELVIADLIVGQHPGLRPEVQRSPDVKRATKGLKAISAGLIPVRRRGRPPSAPIDTAQLIQAYRELVQGLRVFRRQWRGREGQWQSLPRVSAEETFEKACLPGILVSALGKAGLSPFDGEPRRFVERFLAWLCRIPASRVRRVLRGVGSKSVQKL